MLSQISQAPPPISHSDHCHLSFNSNHLHLINTQLSQHYLSTHLTSVSCPISLTRSGLTPTLHSYLPQDCLPPVPRWSSVSLTSACFHPSSSSVLVRSMCSTTSSTSSWQENHHQYILKHSKYLLGKSTTCPHCSNSTSTSHHFRIHHRQSFSAVDCQSHGQTRAILWRGRGVQRFSPTMLTLYRESTSSLYHGKI